MVRGNKVIYYYEFMNVVKWLNKSLGIIVIGLASCITIDPPSTPSCSYNINNNTADTICVRVVFTDSIELIQSPAIDYNVLPSVYEEIKLPPNASRGVLGYEHKSLINLKKDESGNVVYRKRPPVFLPTEIIDSIIISNTNDRVLLAIANDDSLWAYSRRLVSKEFFPGEYYIFYDFAYPLQNSSSAD